MMLSPLNNLHKIGEFGDLDNGETIVNIREIKNINIFQIVKYKNSSKKVSDLSIDQLNLPSTLNVSSNKETRVLWMGPDNWLVFSEKDIGNELFNNFNTSDFAVTDLSHSRAIIELEGQMVKEVIKKGCPINIEDLKKNQTSNSIFHNITVTIDIIDTQPYKLRLIVLRSFGESFYHSISDSCLEFGYRSI